MLSLQYLNKRLKKDHIEKILENYNIKYTTLRKEIDNKINVMMKTITQDLSAFLNNMEDVAAEKEKIKSHEINQNEIETLREQVKDKIHEHTKLKREIEMFKTENNRLKALSNNSSNYQTNTTKKKKANIFFAIIKRKYYSIFKYDIYLSKFNSTFIIKKTKGHKI